MTIIPFERAKKHIVELFRATAEDSKNVVIDYSESMGEWQKLTTDRQINNCLREGELVDGPNTDKFGNSECSFNRLAAGVYIRVTASLYKDKNKNWKLYVTKLERLP